jgi:O-antigen/teichoic acid export membrane protein
MVSGSLSGALQGAQRFDLVNAIQVPTTVGIYLAALFGAWLGLGLCGIIVLIVGVRGVALVGLLVLYTRCLAGFRSFPASMFRALLSFGGWVSVSNVVGPILVYADRVLLGSLVSAAAVGYYAAPYEVVTRALWVLPTAISTTLFPGFSAWTASGDCRTLSRTCGRAVKYLLLLVGGAVAVLVVFADFVLHFWLGREYAEHSTWAMRILSVGVLINSLATVPYAALQGSGRPDLTAKFHLLELPVYIVAAWFLVSLWGVTGAAVAWSARAALDGALLFWASRRFLGVSQESFYEAGIGKVLIGLLGFGLILAGVKACSIYVGPLFQWSVLVLIGVSLLGVSWAVLLDDVDRRLILAWVRRR